MGTARERGAGNRADAPEKRERRLRERRREKKYDCSLRVSSTSFFVLERGHPKNFYSSATRVGDYLQKTSEKKTV